MDYFIADFVKNSKIFCKVSTKIGNSLSNSSATRNLIYNVIICS